jgi:hypothetical protein
MSGETREDSGKVLLCFVEKVGRGAIRMQGCVVVQRKELHQLTTTAPPLPLPSSRASPPSAWPTAPSDRWCLSAVASVVLASRQHTSLLPLESRSTRNKRREETNLLNLVLPEPRAVRRHPLLVPIRIAVVQHRRYWAEDVCCGRERLREMRE